MVDYVLKIDIDETALVRKLKSAMKKAGSLGMGGGGGVGGGTPKGMYEEGAKVGQTIIQMMRNKEHTDRANVSANARVRVYTSKKSQDTAFEMLQQQHRMTRIAKQQNAGIQKMFTAGTLVKLAGLATGVAGLMQMRKMIVDSSPMLQAMLKLLNVGIMFILRPIGDMFGFILRPLMIPFMKFAVSWYASSLKMIPVWTNMGNSILAVLTGNWSDAANYWNLAKAQMAEMNILEKMQLNAIHKNSEGGIEITAGEQEDMDVMATMLSGVITEIKRFINTGDTWDKNKSDLSGQIIDFIREENKQTRETNLENASIGGSESGIGKIIDWLTGNRKTEDDRY